MHQVRRFHWDLEKVSLNVDLRYQSVPKLRGVTSPHPLSTEVVIPDKASVEDRATLWFDVKNLVELTKDRHCNILVFICCDIHEHRPFGARTKKPRCQIHSNEVVAGFLAKILLASVCNRPQIYGRETSRLSQSGHWKGGDLPQNAKNLAHGRGLGLVRFFNLTSWLPLRAGGGTFAEAGCRSGHQASSLALLFISFIAIIPQILTF